MTTAGRLVAFEGIDGSGKSTQIGLTAEWLRHLGHDVVTTFEPTDGPVGRRIREMARSGERVSAELELAWFLEDRRQHVEAVIAPALARGRILLTDRYTLSSVAYQGARGLDWRAILDRSERDFPLPDAALIFSLPAAVGLERVGARAGVAEPAFEDGAFLERVAEILDAIERPYVLRVDAAGDEAAVQAAIQRALGPLADPAQS